MKQSETGLAANPRVLRRCLLPRTECRDPSLAPFAAAGRTARGDRRATGSRRGLRGRTMAAGLQRTGRRTLRRGPFSKGYRCLYTAHAARRVSCAAGGNPAVCRRSLRPGNLPRIAGTFCRSTGGTARDGSRRQTGGTVL